MAINVYQNSGDPNTNWAWFEQQKKAKANLRFRLSLGSPDDKDGLDENHGGAFVLSLSPFVLLGALHRCSACGGPQRLSQSCGRSTASPVALALPGYGTYRRQLRLCSRCEWPAQSDCRHQ